MVELPAADTRVAPFVVVGDLGAIEHSVLLGRTRAMAEPLGSGCTVVSAQTVAEVLPVSVVATE